MEKNTEIVEIASDLAEINNTRSVAVAAVGTFAVAALVFVGIRQYRNKKRKALTVESTEKE